MAKLTVSLIFLGFIIAAIVAFFLKEDPLSDRELREKDKQTPRAVIEDFDVYRYSDAQLTGRMSGRIAKVFEPNIIEMNGNLVGIRYVENDKDTLRCNQATATFQSENLSQMMRSPPLHRVELRELVEVAFNDLTMMTDRAEYLEKTKTISSRSPVHIEGTRREMDGNNGFDYNVESQTFKVHGDVKGQFVPEEKPQ